MVSSFGSSGFSLVAEDETVIEDAWQIEPGYVRFNEKLGNLS